MMTSTPHHRNIARVLEQAFAAQDALNSRINTDWKAQGYDFYRAAWTEVGEAVQHMNWIWWRSGTYKTRESEEQLSDIHVELCDIFHFGISMDLVGAYIAMQKTMSPMDVYYAHTMGIYQLFFAAADDRPAPRESFYEYVEQVVVSAITKKIFDIEAFSLACSAVGLSSTKLFVLYFGKSVLNRFRQDHGYNLPKDDPKKYKKMWTISEGDKPVEDNVYMVQVVKTLLKLNSEEAVLVSLASGEFAEMMYARLGVQYAKQAAA